MIDAQTVLQLLQWGSTIKNDTHAFNNVIRQCVYIIYLYDLSRAVNIEPLHCVSHFFDQIQQPSYLERFEKEVLMYQTKLKELVSVLSQLDRGNCFQTQNGLRACC